MSKTLRVLLVGAAIIGAAVPALAQGTGGGNGGGGGGGGGAGGNGSSNVWDASIPASGPRYSRNHPPTYEPPYQQRPSIEQREDICGQYRGRTYCRPR